MDHIKEEEQLVVCEIFSMAKYKWVGETNDIMWS